MSDNQKSKAELISEVTKLRRKISSLQSQIKNNKSKEISDNRSDILRTLIDAVPDAMYVKDASSRKIIANLADVRNCGCRSESDLIGKDDFEFFPKDVAEKFYNDDQYVIKHAQPVINREEFFYDTAGQKRWLLTNKLPMFDENGVVNGIVGIGRDITQQKVLEMELEECKTRLNSKSF